jgi:transcriptional regulator with XRE-family HTH domain
MAGEYKSFGDFFKQFRKKKKITLREFCIQAQADPANISRMERGAMSTPQDTDILERYASALGIETGSNDWWIIPKDLMSDSEVVSMLPAFFRTLRGQKPTEEEMRKLIEKIKKS